MGALLDLSRDLRFPLRARLLIGRAPECGLVLDQPFTSREHATLGWNGRGWELRDLGSHNGSFVDGRQIPAGSRVELEPGARLGFGRAEPSHVLEDASPPQPLAIDDEGRIVEGSGGLLELVPGDEDGPVVLRGGTGWVVEDRGRVRAVSDGEEIEIDGHPFRLLLPEPVARTLSSGDLPTPERAVFRVSLDEEQVELRILDAGREVDLGVRSHHYLMLVLARIRQEDVQRGGLPLSEQGWVDGERLERMLRQSGRYINVLIHRARRQAVEAGLGCAHRLVERRERAGQLRLGIEEVEILSPRARP